MRVLFGAQGSILKVFCELDRRLREEGVISQSAYWISDSQYYFANRKDFPQLSDPAVTQLYEWEYTCTDTRAAPPVDELVRDELDERYGAFEIWNAILSDRRLMYGALSKVKQDYVGQFNQAQLCDIVYATLLAIDRTIEQLQPEAIITFVPATYGDYLLYLVARARGIRYLQLRSTKIKNFVTFADSLNALPVIIESRYRANLSMKIDYEWEAEASNYLKAASSAPVIYEGTIALKSGKGLQDWLAIAKGFLSAIFRSWRPVHREVTHDNHVPPPVASYLYSVVLKERNAERSLRIMRSRMISLDDLASETYVFFPLHSEPEIALSVYGRDHQNQIELLRRLAQSLPLRWKLIVKEHPRSLGYRTVGYYRHLLDIPNLYFADPSTRPFPWIERARAVATVSGFVGFEAMMTGCPVLVFGDAAYSVLPETMVRHVRCMSDVAAELKDLISNYQRDEDALRAFIAAFMGESVAVNLYSELLGKKGRSSEHEKDIFAQYVALAEHLSSHLKERKLSS